LSYLGSRVRRRRRRSPSSQGVGGISRVEDGRNEGPKHDPLSLR
jgi:hypothetical protein